MTNNDWWNEALETAQAESAGGRGIVGKARVEFGYKVYVSGAKQEETFFPAPAEKTRAEERSRALAKAQELLRKFGNIGKRPAWSLQIRVYRESAVARGEPVSWKDDRFFVTPTYASAFNTVVESLRNAGITALPWEGWARINFVNDPYAEAQGAAGMTDRDADGNPRFPQVAVIAEVYPDELTAYAAGVFGAEVEEAPKIADDCPPGYSRRAWELCIPSIKQALAAGTPPAKIAADYNIPPDWVIRIS